MRALLSQKGKVCLFCCGEEEGTCRLLVKESVVFRRLLRVSYVAKGGLVNLYVVAYKFKGEVHAAG